jgi:hypothetical protein
MYIPEAKVAEVQMQINQSQAHLGDKEFILYCDGQDLVAVKSTGVFIKFGNNEHWMQWRSFVREWKNLNELKIDIKRIGRKALTMDGETL